jgi:hypothetical protein
VLNRTMEPKRLQTSQSFRGGHFVYYWRFRCLERTFSDRARILASKVVWVIARHFPTLPFPIHNDEFRGVSVPLPGFDLFV